jgi:hypothetical protein
MRSFVKYYFHHSRIKFISLHRRIAFHEEKFFMCEVVSSFLCVGLVGVTANII